MSGRNTHKRPRPGVKGNLWVLDGRLFGGDGCDMTKKSLLLL